MDGQFVLESEPWIIDVGYKNGIGLSVGDTYPVPNYVGDGRWYSSIDNAEGD